MSFTYTSAFQSTPPKCRRVLFPFHSFGVWKLVLYQSISSALTLRPTPESEDSIGKGTRMLPSIAEGQQAEFAVTA